LAAVSKVNNLIDGISNASNKYFLCGFIDGLGFSTISNRFPNTSESFIFERFLENLQLHLNSIIYKSKTIHNPDTLPLILGDNFVKILDTFDVDIDRIFIETIINNIASYIESSQINPTVSLIKEILNRQFQIPFKPKQKCESFEEEINKYIEIMNSNKGLSKAFKMFAQVFQNSLFTHKANQHVSFYGKVVDIKYTTRVDGEKLAIIKANLKSYCDKLGKYELENVNLIFNDLMQICDETDGDLKKLKELFEDLFVQLTKENVLLIKSIITSDEKLNNFAQEIDQITK